MEILAGNLDGFIERSGIKAIKTHETTDHKYQTWEIEDSEFEKLCKTNDDDYKDGDWWRSAEGSNMGSVNRRFKIDNHYIKAWDGASREEIEEENKNLPVCDRLSTPREYTGLAEYLCDEIGASQPRNVCALCVDLAKQNKISMAELFRKFYKNHGC